MACTQQSAREYLRTARTPLVRVLKNLSVILQNLNQLGVLSDEEVSEIEAEKHDYNKNRKILDSVIAKGEKACYEFLRIVDMTRKRNQRKTVAATETKEFDLHHWISCFSFNEDSPMDTNYSQGPRSCCRYQRKLKTKAQKISTQFWTANKNMFDENNKPDLSYMPLVLDAEKPFPSKVKKFKSKKIKKSRPKKLRTYIPEDKADTSPSDLLKTDKNILLVGKPGIGKTALTHKLLKLWAERDNKDLDYMFYFDMRKTSHIRKDLSLEDLLFGVFSEPDEGKEEVLQDIKESDSVTLIFDGITDLSVHPSVVQRLIEKDILPAAKVIVTCRPDDEDEFDSDDFLRVEVKGFSEQTIKTYLSAVLGEEQKKVLSNVELLTLCHVPLYALMVAACSSSETPGRSLQPCSMTDIYINIVRHCLQINSKTKNKDLNSFINNKRNEILSLAEVAFHATEEKTVNLTRSPCEDTCILSFLKPLVTKEALTETITTYAFLHYTMQEFFAALWLLKNPDQIKGVFQQCVNEEKNHMKHLIPFMCGLLTEKSPSLMKWLIPDEELKNISKWFFEEMIITFLNSELFLCQCMYESQCPEACIYLLDKLDYQLDLKGESLHSYPCCAVAYVVSQSKERKICLKLEDVMVSEQGMTRLFGCLKNVQWCDPLPQQLWTIFLLSEGQMDHMSLLGLDGDQLHLPVEGKKQLFERAVNAMQKISTKVNVCLHWDRETPVCQDLCESLLEALPHINSLRFRMSCRSPGLQDQDQCHGTLERNKEQLLLDLSLKAALHKGENFHNVVKMLLSLFSVDTVTHVNYILDFYQHVKIGGFSVVIPKLRSFFQSTPSVWSIDLSKRKTSILLEVLKLQSEKKPVKLSGCPDEESEVRSFLQCLPYISQLSFYYLRSGGPEQVQFLVNLFCAAAEREQQTGEKMVELLSSVCTYQTSTLDDIYDDDDYYQSDFLLDLFSHMKDCETKTSLSLLPSLQSLFQSTPSVWSIDLSKRKTSILLEVLKLQSEKKPVDLSGWSDEESEVRSFLQCLPYISQLSFYYLRWSGGPEQVQFLVNLFCAAAEREQQTGEKMVELLSSVCTYQTSTLDDIYDDDDYYQSDFLLDLFSHLKDCETKTSLSLLPSLQSLFQSTPSVWSIDLSKRKTSILLEVLKLQSEKKPVELRRCPDEESEVRSFLQCLPYISQLSFYHLSWSGGPEQVQFLVNLFCAAAEREQQTGEKMVELLSSVCTYQTFPFDDIDDDDNKYYQSDFLLDLFSHLKDCETKTSLSLLPSLQSLFQSTPPVWIIDLSERKTSILLEVLKLQSEKKPVDLRGWSDEESEVRSFLQCLPYISQLSCDPEFFQRVCSFITVRSREEAEQLSSLLQLLGFTLQLTGELPRTSCCSVGKVLRRCGSNVDLVLTPRKMSVRGAFLLFRRTTQLHSLSLSNGMALLLCRWIRRERVTRLVTVEELSLSPQTAPPSLRVLLKVVSSLASLLRYWTVRRLDLTEFCGPVQGLIPLLLHDGPLTIKLSEKPFHQLLSLLYEIQDRDLTWSFLSKVGGDLTSGCLSWELLHYLLQQSSAQTITVDMRKNSFLQESVVRLLPFLDRIVFKRPCPSFVLAAIREIYRARAGPIIPSLLRSLGHVISLTCREMDSMDCAALLFTLQHGDRVKLDLLWTSIPAGKTESILFMLDKVSHLSVDRNLLLRLVHCCAASEAQQGAAVGLLRTLQHRLDLSCSSCVDLDQRAPLRLTGDDCWAVSTILSSSWDTKLILEDCEVEDSGLDLLFPVLDRVRLRASKAVLLQLLSLVPENSERDTVRRAVSLCKALGGELDLSHTRLDQRVCGAVAQMLDFSEELSELDLSHCQLTDQLLLTLSTHLDRVQVLDLSHNNITDASVDMLLQLVSTNPSIDTVRLFGNNIMNRTCFMSDQRFEIW